MPMMLEITEFGFARKVHLIFLLMAAFFYCTETQRTEECLIQSFYRSTSEGNGKSGAGNLLWVNRIFTTLSFNGSCNDRVDDRVFLMEEKAINGSLIVSFFWSADQNKTKEYVIAITNDTLLLEHNDKLRPCHQFIFKPAAANDYEYFPKGTLKSTLSPSYIKTDSTGRPLVGKNPSDVTAWFKIMGPPAQVCTSDKEYT